METNPLEKAIKIAGSQEKLAERVTARAGKEVKQQHVSYWLRHGVPKKWASFVSAAVSHKVKEENLLRWHP